MGIKEEIEKLVEIERKKLEQKDQELLGEVARSKETFAPLVPILKELASAVSEEFLYQAIGDDRAILSVGSEPSFFNWEILWEIDPTREWRRSEKRYVVREQTEGFIGGKEVVIFFDDEAELVTYISKEIAKEVAQLQHRKARS